MDNGKFRYRDACDYITKKHTFKDSDLKKIEKQGVEVFRLDKDATDTQVLRLIERFVGTPPVVVSPLSPSCCQCWPHFTLIDYADRRDNGPSVGPDR